MDELTPLLDNNKKWAGKISREHQGFFDRLAEQQNPEYLWIGCSDSRVPANELIGLLPGEVFVHRNVANMVVHTDFNCLAAIQYAVSILKVKHVIVCGHYGCGGVKAALDNRNHGFIDNWLRHLRDLYYNHRDFLDSLGEQERIDRLCELNVISQVTNICRTTILRQAWSRGQQVSVHGWIYTIANGLLKDMNLTVSGHEEIRPITRAALASYQGKSVSPPA